LTKPTKPTRIQCNRQNENRPRRSPPATQGPGHKGLAYDRSRFYQQARAALNARVSTAEQVEGYSIADQTRDLSDYAESNPYQLVETILDGGYSATDLNRPGLNRILELTKAGKIDVVIAVKRDRFFRSRYHRLLYEQDLQDLGVQLIALNDMGHRLGDAFQDDYAEYEREQILERTLRGKREKARQGWEPDSRCPRPAEPRRTLRRLLVRQETGPDRMEGPGKDEAYGNRAAQGLDSGRGP
jgi:DNA invertase Pin-like site-specific DNA recombinase